MMVPKCLLSVLCLLALMPAWAFPRLVELLSTDGTPVAGATIYYREFTGRIDMVDFGPTGSREEIFTANDKGKLSIDRPVSPRMGWAFGTDYALILAEGFDPQFMPVGDLQYQIYLRPVQYHQLHFVLPDGRPAAGVTFTVTSLSKRIFLLNNPFAGVTTPGMTVTSDKNGDARLPVFRSARTKDGTSNTLVNGIAYCDGYVNEDVRLDSIGPGTFTIPMKPAQVVRGVVTDVQGKPLAGASVRCAEFPLPAVVSDQQGRFTFAHLPTTVAPMLFGGHAVDGSLTLYIDYPGTARQGISVIPASAKADPFVVRMAPLVTISGQLLDRNTGQPVTNSRKYGFYLRIRHSLGPCAPTAVDAMYVTTNLDGAFTCQVPSEACLEVATTFATTVRFQPTTYHDGDTITLQTASR